jgi:hypothetical protein
MPLTLGEASKLSNDVLLQGVVETIIKDSPVLQRMPFIEIVGNGLTYNQDATIDYQLAQWEIRLLPLLYR